MPYAIKTGHFEHNGYQLAYEVHGNSGTPCLLMHGILLDSMVNRELARRFVGEGYQVILLDLLGHGLSDKPTEPSEHRIDFYAEQALACLDYLEIERAMIGGVSLGAIVSLHVADLAPQRCLGLFLEMPLMEWSTTFAAMLLVPLLTVVDYMKWAYRPIAHGLRRLPRARREWLASVINGAGSEPEVINAILHGVLVGPVVPAASRRRQMTMPALVIGHSRDRLHSYRDAVELAHELPHGNLLKARSVLELRTRPKRLWRDIAPFLRRVREGYEPLQGKGNSG